MELPIVVTSSDTLLFKLAETLFVNSVLSEPPYFLVSFATVSSLCYGRIFYR